MMMNCEQASEALMDYIDGRLDDETAQSVKVHLETCPRCRQEEKQLREVMEAIAETPQEQPANRVRENFNRMLRSELKEAAQTGSPVTADGSPGKWRSPWGDPTGRQGVLRMIGQLAAACFLLIAGIAIGTRIGTNKEGTSPGQISALQDEVKDMKQTLMFSLLKEESASERIRGVNYAEEMPHPNGQVIGALISTLNHDKNVNVRLASLYSLAKFSENPVVRDSLVTSLNKQTEPIIQIVMINILAESKEEKAVKPIQDILTNRNTLPEVKNIAREGLKKL